MAIVAHFWLEQLTCIEGLSGLFQLGRETDDSVRHFFGAILFIYKERTQSPLSLSALETNKSGQVFFAHNF